jgi:hypothetical protein
MSLEERCSGPKFGRWQVAGGRWQVAGGRWQVAGGRWQVAGGRLAVVRCELYLTDQGNSQGRCEPFCSDITGCISLS